MIKKKGIPLRVDEEFKDFLRFVKLERIKSGTDNMPVSERRTTKAIARYFRTDFNALSTLIKSPFDNDNKRGGRKLKLI